MSVQGLPGYPGKWGRGAEGLECCVRWRGEGGEEGGEGASEKISTQAHGQSDPHGQFGERRTHGARRAGSDGVRRGVKVDSRAAAIARGAPPSQSEWDS